MTKSDTTSAATRSQRASEPEDEGTAFKREGPTPASVDTGTTVEDMNEAAERSIRRNISPGDDADS